MNLQLGKAELLKSKRNILPPDTFVSGGSLPWKKDSERFANPKTKCLRKVLQKSANYDRIMICKLEKLYFICDYSQIIGSSNGKNAEYFETNRNYIDEIIHSCYNFLIEHKRKRVRWKVECD